MRAHGLVIGMALALLASPLAAAEFRAGAVTVSAPWARATPGGATTAAVYLSLAVAGAEGDRLVKAASTRAERAELHAGSEQGGVQRMTAVESIEVKPGPAVTLTSGRLHIMLIGLKMPLTEGEMLPLSLTFVRAGAVEIGVPVLALAAKGPADVEPLDDPHAGH